MYPVFKGATRPVAVLGVPQVPLFFACAGIVAISVFIGIPPLAFPLCGIAILIMRAMAAKDDQIFRQLFLHIFLNKVRNANSKTIYAGVNAFAPQSYRKVYKNSRQSINSSKVGSC